MIDRRAMSERFFQCYHGLTRVEMAALFGVKHPSVVEWYTRGRVPWERVKYLSDSQAISWDWLILGRTPAASRKKAKTPKSTKPQFDTAGINGRFLSLFEMPSQSDIARLLRVTPNAVHE
ncbi:MAG: helix-turn-helix domain containing protein [Planctomycetaceae bacterium]|nr:helix-turn-helix domain containing protein [Planctomycetaceae bacterium]